MKPYIPLLLLSLSCAIQPVEGQSVQKFSATQSADGIPYSLPVTVLDITIEIETTVKEPGEFYKYARKYFNESTPITESSTTVAVKSIVVGTHGEADPGKRYVAVFKSGQTPFMMLDNSGIPLAINTETLKEVSSVDLPTPRAAEPTPLERPEARQALSEEILQSKSISKRAELVAAQIFALRQSRNDLITGQADQMPPDGKSMELILNNINAQEAALMAMFVGTEKVSTDVATIEYTPQGDTDVETKRIIARVSAANGIVDPDELSGAPVYVSLNVTDRPSLPTNAKGQVIEIPKDGFIYRLPGKVDVTVSFDGETMASASVEMAQYGVDYGLKANVFTDKKAPAYAIFDPATGAIVQMGTVQ